MLEALGFFALMEAAGLAAAPLAALVLGRLPGAGLGFAKVLGVLLIGGVAWMAGSIGPASYGPATILGAFVIVGDTDEDARAKRAKLDSLVHYDSDIASLSVILGTDASKFDPEGQLPEIPETNASKSGRQRLVDVAARDKLTVRQLAQRVGGYGGLSFVGTPVTIADKMQEWLETEGCDGFNIMFPFLPQGLDDFVDRVVPELQNRGIFRREYEGRTLRENLGLPRPKNRFFEAG